MPPLVAAAGVASVTGRGLTGLAGRLATVGRRPQGIADGADGHAERIEADRGRPGRVADLPAAARCADMTAPRPTGAVPNLPAEGRRRRGAAGRGR